MPLTVEITRRAAADIERIAQWWASNRLSAPGAVRHDLHATFAVLSREPGLGSPVPHDGPDVIRRFHVQRIRYWIYYRVRGERLQVVSVWHASRGEPPKV